VITAFYRSVYQSEIALCTIMNMSVKKCQSDILENENRTSMTRNIVSSMLQMTFVDISQHP